MAALLVNLTTQLLDLQIVEGLMHQQVDSDDLVELIDTQATNGFENTEENRTEDR